MNLINTNEYDSDKNFIPMTEKYFEYFGTKNPKGLEGIYASDIELKDWNGIWKGRLAVLEMNESIFDNELFVKVDTINQCDNITYAHITITINDIDLKVLDVIEWTDAFQIKSIHAYDGTLR
jgi:hypothetical protein